MLVRCNVLYLSGLLHSQKYGKLHEFACHPCSGAMLISVLFQFLVYVLPKRALNQVFLTWSAWMSFKGVHEHPKNICKMCLYAPRVFCWKKVQFLIRFSMGYGLEKMNNYDMQNSYIMKKLHLMKTVPWKTLMENPNL